MRHFAEIKEKQENGQSNDSDKISENDNPELGLLIIAKRIGLSHEELNMFTLQNFIDYVDMWTGNDSTSSNHKSKNKVVERPATQEDIDNFYSRM